MGIKNELLKNLDLLSCAPEIKINGNSRFTTKFGIITSLLSLIIILIFAVSTIINVLSRKKLTVVYNLDNRETPIININSTQPALLILDAMGGEIENFDRYYSIMVKYLKVEIPNNYSENNSTEYIKNIKPKGYIYDVPIINCKKMKFSKFQLFYTNLAKVYSSGFCIDFSNFNYTLFGKYGSLEGYSTLNIFINKCVNSTLLNKTDCFPEDVINKRLSQVYLNLITIENDVDSNNFEQPIMEFYNNELLPISSTIYKNHLKDMNSIKLKSNNGLIMDDYTNYESSRTDNIIESVDQRGSNTIFPGTISQIIFRCSGKTEFYFRTYMKIPASFAEIGGILQAILFLGRLIVHFYSKNSMLNYLIFFNFNKEEINYFSINPATLRNSNNISIPHDNSNVNLNFNPRFHNIKKIPEANIRINVSKNIICKNHNNKSSLIIEVDKNRNMQVDKNDNQIILCKKSLEIEKNLNIQESKNCNRMLILKNESSFNKIEKHNIIEEEMDKNCNLKEINNSSIDYANNNNILNNIDNNNVSIIQNNNLLVEKINNDNSDLNNLNQFNHENKIELKLYFYLL